MNNTRFLAPVDKTASKTNLAQDFVGGMDPFGAWTSEYGSRNEQAGVSANEHAVKGSVAVAGGLMGGGLILPSVVSGAAAASRRKGVAGRLTGFGQGFMRPMRDVKRGIKVNKKINEIASGDRPVRMSQGDIDDMFSVMEGSSAAPLIRAARGALGKVNPRFNPKAGGKGGAPKASALDNVSNQVEMASDLRHLSNGRITPSMAKKMQGPARDAKRMVALGLGTSAGFGGLAAGVQYKAGIERERETQDRIGNALRKEGNVDESIYDRTGNALMTAGGVAGLGFLGGEAWARNRHKKVLDQLNEVGAEGNHLGKSKMQDIASLEGFDGRIEVGDKSRWEPNRNRISVNAGRQAEFMHELGHTLDAKRKGMDPTAYAASQEDGLLRQIFMPASKSNKLEAERAASVEAKRIARRHGLAMNEQAMKSLQLAEETHRLGLGARNMRSRAVALGVIPAAAGLGIKYLGRDVGDNRSQNMVRDAEKSIARSGNNLNKVGTIKLKGMFSPVSNLAPPPFKPPKQPSLSAPKPKQPKKNDWASKPKKMTRSKIQKMT